MRFVGRDRELTELAAALQDAAEGRISRVALLGPPGIGVTRLLDELELRLRDVPDVSIARGRAQEPFSGVPYHALAEALSGLLRRLSDAEFLRVATPAAYDLATLVPEVEERLRALGTTPKEPLLSAPDQRGVRLTEAILGMLERSGSGDAVVLLVLEDLHWADPATRAFVEALLRLTRSLPLCLVVTYAPDELHRRHPMADLAERLSRDETVQRIVLQPLGREEVFRLVESLAGERPPISLVAAVTEGSGGNPLQAEQLVGAHESLAGVRLSDPFAEIVHARLAAADRAAVRCLQILAACRRALPRDFLLGLVLPQGRLTPPALAGALETGLAVSDTAGDKLLIAHELYAEAVETLASPPERQALHAAIAARLPGPAAERAWHLEAAMDFPGARTAHLAAAEEATPFDPGSTALVHLARALELLGPSGRGGADEGGAAGGRGAAEGVAHEEGFGHGDDGGDGGDGELPHTPESARLLDRTAQAAFIAGSFRRAATLIGQAIEQRATRDAVARATAAGALGVHELQLEVGLRYERLGRYSWTAGDQETGMAAFQKALELIPLDSVPERAHALAALAQHLMLDGRFSESAAIAENARDVAAQGGPASLAALGHATCTLGVDVAYGGQIERGLELLEDATRIARRARRLDDLMRSYANRTTLLDLDLRREQALAVVKEGIREAKRGGLEQLYGAFLRGNAADILFTLGRWREAEAECRAALEWTPTGVAWLSPLLYLGLVLVESQADDEAARLVGQILLQVETIPQGQWSALFQRVAVSLALWQGDALDAQRVAEREWDRVAHTGDAGQLALGASTTLEACAAAADWARSRRDYAAVAAATGLGARVLGESTRAVAASELPRTLGVRRETELHLGMAHAHLARLRGRATATDWSRLADAWAAIPVPYQEAKARWWQAATALQGNEGRSVARAPLTEAWGIADALPARPLQRALEDLARRARITLPPRADAALAAPISSAGGSLAVGAESAGWDAEAAWEVEATSGELTSDESMVRESAAAVGSRLVAVGPGRSSPGQRVAVGPGRPTGSGDALASSPTGRAIGARLMTPREPSAVERFGLSPRENEVLLVLAQGRTNREIAERLFISERTVGVHVRKILAKLGVSGRVEAAGLAIRLGLVPADRPLAELLAGGGRR